ncbi:hypothetical protein BDE02_08G201200 [Populus trichocarpa]|nr:hypothetical protein BDE02_08G201200 [Populus trichocarpa]
MRGSSGERQSREGKVCGKWERLAVASGFGRDGNEGSVLMTGGLWLSLVLAKREGRLQQVKRGRTALPVRWWGEDEMVVGAKTPQSSHSGKGALVLYFSKETLQRRPSRWI